MTSGQGHFEGVLSIFLIKNYRWKIILVFYRKLIYGVFIEDDLHHGYVAFYRRSLDFLQKGVYGSGSYTEMPFETISGVHKLRVVVISEGAEPTKIYSVFYEKSMSDLKHFPYNFLNYSIIAYYFFLAYIVP